MVVIENTATPDLCIKTARNDPLLLPPIHTQSSNCYQKLPEFECAQFQNFFQYQTESPCCLDYKNWPQFDQHILPYQTDLPNFLDCKSLLSKQRTDFTDCGCKKWPRNDNILPNFKELDVKEDLVCPRWNGYECCQQNDQLILPPAQVELFEGLGYFASAVPYVASCFEPAVEMAGKCSGANIPIASPYSCLTLASPISPDWAPLVRAVIL